MGKKDGMKTSAIQKKACHNIWVADKKDQKPLNGRTSSILFLSFGSGPICFPLPMPSCWLRINFWLHKTAPVPGRIHRSALQCRWLWCREQGDISTRFGKPMSRPDPWMTKFFWYYCFQVVPELFEGIKEVNSTYVVCFRLRFVPKGWGCIGSFTTWRSTNGMDRHSAGCWSWWLHMYHSNWLGTTASGWLMQSWYLSTNLTLGLPFCAKSFHRCFVQDCHQRCRPAECRGDYFESSLGTAADQFKEKHKKFFPGEHWQI